MKIAVVTLVILVPAKSCVLENIDSAQPETAQFQTMEECQSLAATVDARRNMRAFCLLGEASTKEPDNAE